MFTRMWRSVFLLLGLSALAALPRTPASVSAGAEPADSDYESRVNAALRSSADLWGERLIARPEGPTYENMVEQLRPLMLCGKEFTASGVYYLVFGRPASPARGEEAALHVADGSEVISRHHKTGSRLTVFVGPEGQERYGQSLSRLNAPTLRTGYQPVLTTEYTDAAGNRYRQESFADTLPDANTTASFIALEVSPAERRVANVKIRLEVSERGLSLSNSRLVQGQRLLLSLSPGAEIDDRGVVYRLSVPAGEKRRIFLIRPLDPLTGPVVSASDSAFLAAREGLCRYWDRKLAEGSLFQVSEQRVMNAQRNILIQNLFLGWKYSYGNAYEDFFQPEGNDAATLLGLFGYPAEQKACHLALLEKTKGRGHYFNWENGEKLAHAAHYYFLTEDRAFINSQKKRYDEFIHEMSKQMGQDQNGLLKKEPYSGDIATAGYYLHQQAVCWRGLRDMARVYQKLGYSAESEACFDVASRLRKSLNAAIAKSQTEMDDGTLFVPTELLSDRRPYDPVTQTKLGTYWNLVFPYALGSGLFPPKDSRRILDYMFRHGSFFLGLLRCNYYPVAVGSYRENGLAGYSTPGADNVYLVNVIDALAEQNLPDRLVLALYGKMCHGMTHETFVSGEGDSYGVVPGEHYRAMYLPPNSANNSLFLKILRTMVLFEKEDERGEAADLLLTHFTPRGWLADEQRISFSNSPSLFGKVSLRLVSELSRNQIRAVLEAPDRRRPSRMRLRLRTPGKRRITSVTVNRRSHDLFDPLTETIDLSGLSRTLNIVAQY